jgi:uncharacterized iron-regulated membrane protein
MIKTLNSNLSSRPAPQPKHKLLAQSRKWHTWGGLFAALFLIVIGATGIVLNYKKPIFTALGLEDERGMKMKAAPEEKRARQEHQPSAFTTVSGFTAATVTAEQALALARESLGEVPLERIELKSEHGEMLYKIKAASGDELWVNALTGTHFIKGEYEKVKAAPDGAVVARRTDWGKIMIDLHTGKIGGEVGKAIMTAASVLLLLLSVSGVYMWLKPVLIRRDNAKAKTRTAATPAAVPAPLSTAPKLSAS